MLAGKRIDPMPETAQGPSGSDFNNIQKGSARGIAAKVARVSHDTVQGAMDVKRADPKEFERIKSGKITVETARRKMSPSPTGGAEAGLTRLHLIAHGRRGSG